MITTEDYLTIIRPLDWRTAEEWADALDTTRQLIYRDDLTTVTPANGRHRGWWFKHPLDERNARYTCVVVDDILPLLKRHRSTDLFAATARDRTYTAGVEASYVVPARVIAWEDEALRIYGVDVDEARKVARSLVVYSALVDQLAWCDTVGTAHEVADEVDISYGSIYRSARALAPVTSRTTGATWRFVRGEGNPLPITGYHVDRSNAAITGELSDSCKHLSDDDIHALAQASMGRAMSDDTLIDLDELGIDSEAIDRAIATVRKGSLYDNALADSARSAEIANLRDRIGELEKFRAAVVRISKAIDEFTDALRELGGVDHD